MFPNLRLNLTRSIRGSGIKRIFSKNTLVEFLKSILKITIFFMILSITPLPAILMSLAHLSDQP